MQSCNDHDMSCAVTKLNDSKRSAILKKFFRQPHPKRTTSPICAFVDLPERKIFLDVGSLSDIRTIYSRDLVATYRACLAQKLVLQSHQLKG